MGEANAPVVRLEAPAAGTTASRWIIVEPARTVSAEDEMHVPFVTIGPMPLVEWTDAGGTKRRFLIDTGANAVIFRRASAPAKRGWVVKTVDVTFLPPHLFTPS